MSARKVVVKQFGHYTKRLTWQITERSLPVDHLLHIQLNSYKWLLREGIQQLIDQTFPVESTYKKLILSVEKVSINSPIRTIAEAKLQSRHYEIGIVGMCRLFFEQEVKIDHVEGRPLVESLNKYYQGKFREPKLIKKIDFIPRAKANTFHTLLQNKKTRRIELLVEVLEQKADSLLILAKLQQKFKIFIVNLPYMTPKGTFIVNGIEKNIVSQIVRSAGIYFKKTSLPVSSVTTFSGDLIAVRGAWVSFETLLKKDDDGKMQRILSSKINKSTSFNLMKLLIGLGLEPDYITQLFAHEPIIIASIKRVKLSGRFDIDHQQALNELRRRIIGSAINYQGIGPDEFFHRLFFAPDFYELKAAGRYKLNHKLCLLDRAEGHYLAEDVLDQKTKRVLMSAGTLLVDHDWVKFCQLVAEEHCDVALKTIHKQFGNMVQRVVITPFTSVHGEWSDSLPKTAVIGQLPTIKQHFLTLGDIVAGISYLINLHYHIGDLDDIDNLANRRVRLVGELIQNQMVLGFNRMKANWMTQFRIANLVSLAESPISQLFNSKPLISLISEFFNLSPLCQFLDQTNVLTELATKRLVTATGPGGLSKEKISINVRDVNVSYYGRFCPIQTPEGPHIGLINNFAVYARVNPMGFIETPYFVVKNGVLTDEVVYLNSLQEEQAHIAPANVVVDAQGKLLTGEIIARFRGEITLVSPEKVAYVDVAPQQLVSIAAGCIPFLENDDANRALMGANMLRQGVPLLIAEAPLVATGMEHFIALHSGDVIVNKYAGVVTYADARRIEVKSKDKTKVYHLTNFLRSNQLTMMHQTPLVKTHDHVKAGQIITDCAGVAQGELALGKNVLMAFSTWKGYNFEDAIVLSERLVTDDVFTSIHIEEYKLECRRTRQGLEEITRELVSVAEAARQYLDEDGLVLVGTEVHAGDVLVGKITPLGQINLSAEDKLLSLIFGSKAKKTQDNSLRLPNGGDGKVIAVKRFTHKDAELAPDVLEIVKVYVAQKRKIQPGDKMAGRHGNKGVVSIIAPVEDMPFTADGTPIDVILNPLGVPSRMNIGQVLEMHLGYALSKKKQLGAVPVFEGPNDEELRAFMDDNGITDFGKQVLYDGTNGEALDQKISLGVMYLMKLSHMVEDKVHARATGPYSLITQQPLGGKAQNGGQRFGEMEVWALEAYGASRTLQEMLTIKSDDLEGRDNTYQAIIWDRKIPAPNIPESFNVLLNEIKGLGFNFTINNPSKSSTTRPRRTTAARHTVGFDDLRRTRAPRVLKTNAQIDQALTKELLSGKK